MEPTLLEETLNLVRTLDATDDPVEAALLEARIAERSDDLGDLSGFVVATIDDGEWLACCLDEEQARALQTALLTTEGGFVTVVLPALASIEDFVHPETPVSALTAILVKET